ncbi:MAG: hypothetical protein COA52_15730, partial [Hyphomicrobiales bacterium]
MNQPTKTMTVRVDTSEANGRALLAPMGLATPHSSLTGFAVQGAQPTTITEATTGQTAALIPYEALAGCETISFVYDYSAAPTLYPKTMFEPRDSKYTRAARALIHEVQNLPRVAQGGLAAIEAIMEHTAHSFSYGHPDTRFNDGLDEVPHLGCGITQGSCVDINTYLIAALRAAEIEAGYVTGGFFPAEKHGVCDDMHCWVVTRHNDKTL